MPAALALGALALAVDSWVRLVDLAAVLSGRSAERGGMVKAHVGCLLCCTLTLTMTYLYHFVYQCVCVYLCMLYVCIYVFHVYVQFVYMLFS